jgi:hypothetical protein
MIDDTGIHTVDDRVWIGSEQDCQTSATTERRSNTCPLCKGPLIRVRRRFVDRLMSLVRPVSRYRCSIGCDWEGNLSARR